MAEFNASFRTAWSLIKPYWFSEERWRARLLLLVVIALTLGQVFLSVLLNKWNNAFYNALQDKKLDIFLHQLVVFTELAVAYILIAVYRQYLNQMLQINWRSWMTRNYQTSWLSKRAYYRLQAIYKNTDNPDQRIAQDIDIFTSNTLALTIGLINKVVTLVSFAAILWGLSGALSFTVLGHAITIPGYMLWAALLYAIVGTWLTHRIGRRLVTLDFDQQRYEANYRFSLIRIRENAEAIAFYQGEQVEMASLRDRFSQILTNWWQIMRKQKQLNFFNSGYSQIATIFPFIVAAPRYFSGAIQLGGLMQTASAFGEVQGALSWFIDVYTQFATWKATTNRLASFTSMITMSDAETTTSPIVIAQHADTTLTVQHLSLTLPDGSALLNDIDFTLNPGDRMLITGNSGCGKTTLLRAIAGLWPYGTGAIGLPQNATMLFIPQKPYLPNLPLRDVICYPQAADAYSEQDIQQALNLVGMPQLGAQLATSDQWSQSLSLGEQQKLAFARIFLQRPALLLLDEVTASLDVASEAALYEALIAQLPKTIILSIGHRATLKAWHHSEKPL